MPYFSDAQRRFFHTPTGLAKIGADKVAEFDQASKGLKLPERAGTKKTKPAINYGAMVSKAQRYTR